METIDDILPEDLRLRLEAAACHGSFLSLLEMIARARPEGLDVAYKDYLARFPSTLRVPGAAEWAGLEYERARAAHATGAGLSTRTASEEKSRAAYVARHAERLRVDPSCTITPEIEVRMMHGGCAEFAIALHETLSLPLAAIWEVSTSGDRSLSHAFVTRAGNALDVRGERPVLSLYAEVGRALPEGDSVLQDAPTSVAEITETRRKAPRFSHGDIRRRGW